MILQPFFLILAASTYGFPVIRVAQQGMPELQAEKAATLDTHRWNDSLLSSRVALNNSSAISSTSNSAEVVTRCGPKLQLGKVRFAEWEMRIPWSSARLGTSCKNVAFEKEFPTKYDILVILT